MGDIAVLVTGMTTGLVKTSWGYPVYHQAVSSGLIKTEPLALIRKC